MAYYSPRKPGLFKKKLASDLITDTKFDLFLLAQWVIPFEERIELTSDVVHIPVT